MDPWINIVDIVREDDTVETLKTAFVVVLLMVVLYGVYALVTKDGETEPPPGFEFAMESDLQPPTIEGGGLPMSPEQGDSPAPWSDPLTSGESSPTVVDPGAPYAQQPTTTTPPAQPPYTADGATAPSGPDGTDQQLTPPPGFGLPGEDVATTDQTANPAKSPYPDPSAVGAAEPVAGGSNSTPDAGSRFGGGETADTGAPGSRYGGAPVGGGDFRASEGGFGGEPSSTADSGPPLGDDPAGQYGVTEPPQDGASGTSATRSPFPAASARAKSLIAQGKFKDALYELSLVFNHPGVTPEEEKELHSMLDPLAAKVIYSRGHYMKGPHLVTRGDTLDSIAKEHNVPAQLLQKINGVRNNGLLLQDEKIKVVPGPFRAEVDLTKEWVVLFVDSLYAGRFMISIGADPSPQPGEYTVKAKEPGKTYYASDGRTLNVGDPSNPYGNAWIDLGSEMSIHGSGTGPPQGLGCVSLSPLDAADVYGILSVGSKIKIRR